MPSQFPCAPATDYNDPFPLNTFHPIQFAISWFTVTRGSAIPILIPSFARGIGQFVDVGLRLLPLLSLDG